jgi:hypothetical protein
MDEIKNYPLDVKCIALQSMLKKLNLETDPQAIEVLVRSIKHLCKSIGNHYEDGK